MRILPKGPGDYWVSDFWRVWVFGLPAAVFLYAIVLRELEQGRVFLPQACLSWRQPRSYRGVLSGRARSASRA